MISHPITSIRTTTFTHILQRVLLFVYYCQELNINIVTLSTLIVLAMQGQSILDIFSLSHLGYETDLPDHKSTSTTSYTKSPGPEAPSRISQLPLGPENGEQSSTSTSPFSPSLLSPYPFTQLPDPDPKPVQKGYSHTPHSHNVIEENLKFGKTLGLHQNLFHATTHRASPNGINPYAAATASNTNKNDLVRWYEVEGAAGQIT